MTNPDGTLPAHKPGFTDVDRSGRAQDLVAYLAELAALLQAVRREAFARLGVQPGQHVLDVGCGAGEVCVELASWVGPQGRVCGIDPSSVMLDSALAAARKAGANVELTLAQADRLPYAAGSFDAVRAERVFQHLIDPQGALAEMMRVTRPGGRIMVIDPDHGQLAFAATTPAQRRAGELIRATVLHQTTDPHIGTRLVPLFREAGLDDVEVTARAFPAEWPVIRQALRLEQRLDDAVRQGAITQDEARSTLAEMQALHESRRYFSSGVYYSVVGTKPGA